MKTKTTWQVSNIDGARYLGSISVQDKNGEDQSFELLETADRIVFGGACNIGLLESGYILKDGRTVNETLSELFYDLTVYYTDGPAYTSDIVCNERM